MKPATEEEIKQLKHDYEQFIKLGNGVLKAAYLATSGRGFTEIKGAINNTVILCRENDNSFICFSSSYKRTPATVDFEVVGFSTDLEFLKKKDGE